MVFFRALRALINFNGPDKPHLVPPPTPMGLGAHLSSARSLHSFLWAVLGEAVSQLSCGPADPDPWIDFPVWPHCDIALLPGLLVGPGYHLQLYLHLLLRYCGKGLWLVRGPLPTTAAAPLAMVSLLAPCHLESSQPLLPPDNVHGLMVHVITPSFWEGWDCCYAYYIIAYRVSEAQLLTESCRAPRARCYSATPSP